MPSDRDEELARLIGSRPAQGFLADSVRSEPPGSLIRETAERLYLRQSVAEPGLVRRPPTTTGINPCAEIPLGGREPVRQLTGIPADLVIIDEMASLEREGRLSTQDVTFPVEYLGEFLEQTDTPPRIMGDQHRYGPSDREVISEMVAASGNFVHLGDMYDVYKEPEPAPTRFERDFDVDD